MTVQHIKSSNVVRMVKVNIGCGNAAIPGFINIDVRKTKCTDIVANADKLPLESNSVEEVFARYVIEHFNRHEVKHVLHEWNRILKVGGKLIIHTLNVEELNRILLHKYISWDHYNYLLFGGQDYKENTHKLAISKGYLQELVSQRGFGKLKVTSKSKKFEDIEKGVDTSRYCPLIVFEAFKIKESKKIIKKVK